MLDVPVLSEIECRILNELLFCPKGTLTCHEITILSNISSSTWSKEKKSLWVNGLMEIEDTKEFDIDDRVARRMFVKLTPKGKVVARLLVETSNVLISNQSLINDDVQLLRNPSTALQV